jgi:hypothetical protein
LAVLYHLLSANAINHPFQTVKYPVKLPESFQPLVGLIPSAFVIQAKSALFSKIFIKWVLQQGYRLIILFFTIFFPYFIKVFERMGGWGKENFSQKVFLPPQKLLATAPFKLCTVWLKFDKSNFRYFPLA